MWIDFHISFTAGFDVIYLICDKTVIFQFSPIPVAALPSVPLCLKNLPVHKLCNGDTSCERKPAEINRVQNRHVLHYRATLTRRAMLNT